MKKAVFVLMVFVCGCLSSFAQNIDRSKYLAIDPFDFKLTVKQVKNGAVRQYKSTVQFSMQSGTDYYFRSLDGGTTLSMEVAKRFNPMKAGQKVTIYYTATKNAYMDVDSVILDDIDYENTTEVKPNSVNNTSVPQVDRSKYLAIDPFDFKLTVKQVKNGAVRQYKSIVQFSMQSGTDYYFRSLDGGTTLSMEVTKRFNPMKVGQKVTIYYTVTKNAYMDVDSVILDDIEY
jgi:hypothetical protein